jgi:hypothetical protein
VAGIAALLLGLAAGPAAAPVPRPDTTRVAPADSAGKSRPDSARQARPDSAAGPGAALAPAAPADSVLAAACAGGGSLAADLLVVLFTPAATEADRLELAKAAGGKLAGPADAVRPGAWYLRVPNADLDPTVADRVIRLPTVQEVGPAPCRLR